MRCCWIALFLALGSTALFPSVGIASDPLVQLRASAETRDFLGVRVLARKMVGYKTTIEHWNAVRAVLVQHPEIGNDLVLGWERARPSIPRIGKTLTPIEEALDRADELLLSGKNIEAFELYQRCARWLKGRAKHRDSIGSNADTLYPYVLHGMARALYAAKRFADALEVYTWITPAYPKFRQTLFEKMWAALRSGRVDEALGAIASQRSDFFSRFMNPEAYLLQVYLYKVLCRDEDLRRTLAEITDFKNRLKTGRYGYLDWAKSDFEMRALANLAQLEVREDASAVSVAERKTEQQRIHSFLKRVFHFHQARIFEHLTLIEAYARLAATPGIGAGLKPIEKLPSRAELFRKNLEVWPADDAEAWIDEIGKYRFVGESLCAANQ